MMRRLAVAVAVGGLLLTACSGAGSGDGNTAPSQDAASIASGQQLWGLNCAACHGLNGQGMSGAALNSQEFFQATSDEQIVDIVRTGVPGTTMPAWANEHGGPFTDQQITEVVAYIRSWEETAPSCPDWLTLPCSGTADGA
jgi:cytochrome c oxidase cbb3-type subunit III